MTEESFRFPKTCRLRNSAEFSAVYEHQCREGDGFLLVFAMRNDLGLTRCGLSVSKKHGGAVQRNRLKRLLREAFRLARNELPVGLDLVLIPKQNSGGTLRDYRDSLLRITRRLARRLNDT